MIITKRDVADFEQMLTQTGSLAESIAFPEEEFMLELSVTSYFANNPHLLLALGFDEYLGPDGAGGKPTQGVDLPRFRVPTGEWFELISPPWGPDDNIGFNAVSNRRKQRAEDEVDFLMSVPKCLMGLRSYASKEPIGEEKRLWTPRLWTPQSQENERVAIADTLSAALKYLTSEGPELSALSWKQFEDLVAELLRARGMEIHVVKERPQGGRDIIARGELIPGREPFEMAVEVKHKDVVGRPEVEKALWQNRDYPALLFATSGRFTAGVVAEKRLSTNRRRLFLADGKAIGTMVRDTFGMNSGTNENRLRRR